MDEGWLKRVRVTLWVSTPLLHDAGQSLTADLSPFLDSMPQIQRNVTACLRVDVLLSCAALSAVLAVAACVRKASRRFTADVPSSLSQGKQWVLDWPMCSIYMMNDSQYPAWIMMVPRKVGPASRAQQCEVRAGVMHGWT